MKKSMVALAFALVGLGGFTVSAQAVECPFAKPVVHHHHHVRHGCPPKKVVQTPAPKVAIEKPVEHVTKVIEKVVVEHEVVEMPTRVVVVPSRPCCATLAPRSPAVCCPPGVHLPNLPPCGPSGSVYHGSGPQGIYQQASFAQSSNLTPHGPNKQCIGQPKNVWFTCISPTSGQQTNCICE